MTSFTDIGGQPSTPAPAGGIIGASGEAPESGPINGVSYQDYLTALNDNQWYGVKPTPMTAAQYAVYAKNSGLSSVGGLPITAQGQDPVNSAVLASMSAAQQQQYNAAAIAASKQNNGGFWNAFNTVAPYLIVAGAAAGTGGAASGALGGGLAGAIGGGAAAGAVGTAGNDSITNQPLTLGSVGKGALIGGAAGGLGYEAQPAAGALSSATGLPAPVASGVVKGAIGSGIGALGSAVGGGNIGNGALVGGLGGAASGLVGSATGSPALGTTAGTIAAGLANKYLTSPSTTTLPPMSGAPGSVTGTAQLPSLPGTSTTPPTGQNLSGLGYAPRQQTNYSGIDFNNYGQGPEANFFTSNSNPAPYQASTNIGAYSGYTPPKSTATQGAITPQNST